MIWQQPPVLLFDLDDTIVTFDQHSTPAWQQVCEAATAKRGQSAADFYREIQRVADAYWADPERHRLGRLDLDNTRRRLVRVAFGNLGIDMTLATQVTDASIALNHQQVNAECTQNAQAPRHIPVLKNPRE